QDGWIRMGEAFSLAAPAGTNGVALVFFRPEDVEILTNGQGDGHPATVEVKTFLGSLTRLHLVADIDGRQARMQADLPSRQALAPRAGAASCHRPPIPASRRC